MIEFLRHLFGVCGEAHPNIFTALFVSIPGISYITYKLKLIFKRK